MNVFQMYMLKTNYVAFGAYADEMEQPWLHNFFCAESSAESKTGGCKESNPFALPTARTTLAVAAAVPPPAHGDFDVRLSSQVKTYSLV